MAERHFYNDKFKFEGSMDDDGRIYDSRHRFIGRVEGDTIYDNCNLPRGHINADGQVTDLNNIPTGREFGANFVGWRGHGSGMGRNDVLGTGLGNDYGIFSRVKDANRQYGMDDDDDDDDDDDYEGEDYDEGYDEIDDDTYDTPSRSRHHARRRGEDESMSNDDPEASCVGCGCVALIVAGILIALYLYS